MEVLQQIFSWPEWEETPETSSKSCQAVCAAGQNLNLKKCTLLNKESAFLEHIVEVTSDLATVAALRDGQHYGMPSSFFGESSGA